MTSIFKNVYIDKSDDIVNEYNSKYHSTIIIKLTDVKSSKYIHFGIENNEKDLKFEVGDHVKISQHKNMFAKGFAPNLPEVVFVIKKVTKNCAVDISHRRPKCKKCFWNVLRKRIAKGKSKSE